MHNLSARSPACARHANQIAGSITSGGMSGAHPGGAGSAAAASIAVASAILLPSKYISSAPETSAEAEQALRTAA
ncbi:MAG: hypothetical protein ACTHJW_29195 [Streptosporangiaceae bacterium]